MAGEGDKGHCAELDCLEWSRTFLSSLLSGLTILDGEGGLYIRIKALHKLEGEAYLKPAYELALSLSWEGEARDAAVKVSGSVEVPYLADENAKEDPEVKVTVRDDDGPVGRRIKDAFIAKGKPVVLEKLRTYVEAMTKGVPAKDELETKKPPSVATKTSSAPEEKKKTKDGFKTISFKTISLTEKFYCRARYIYEILMDENRWKVFTQSNARISKEVGGQFSLFDGSITGLNEELQESKLIVQKWRFESWPEGIFSTVKLIFDEPEHGVTIVKLVQTDVPEEDKYGNASVVENTEKGWRDLVFKKIRAVYGFWNVETPFTFRTEKPLLAELDKYMQVLAAGDRPSPPPASTDVRSPTPAPPTSTDRHLPLPAPPRPTSKDRRSPAPPPLTYTYPVYPQYYINLTYPAYPSINLPAYPAFPSIELPAYPSYPAFPFSPPESPVPSETTEELPSLTETTEEPPSVPTQCCPRWQPSDDPNPSKRQRRGKEQREED